MVAAHKAIGVGIDRLGDVQDAVTEDDGDAARGTRRIVAERDGFADERRVDFVHHAAETDGAVLLHLALLLEEEELVEMIGGLRQSAGGRGPARERRFALESAMRRLVVLVLEPGPEAAIQRVETARVPVDERGQELSPTRAKEPFNLPLRLRLVGAGVDQGHAQLRADEREMPRTIGRSVVDVEPGGHPAALEGPREDRQEREDVLAAGKRRVRHDARRVVEQRDQIRLVPTAILVVLHARAVHHVAHPEVVGERKRKAPTVLRGGGLRGAHHQAVARQEAMHGRGRHDEVRRDQAALARRRDQHQHAEGGGLLLQRAQRVGDGRRERTRPADIAPRPRLQRVEAAAAIGVEPLPQRPGRDASARGAGNVVLAIGLLLEPGVEGAVAGAHVAQIGDEPVAEERHGVGMGGEIRRRHRSSLTADGRSGGSSAGWPRAVSPHRVLARGHARRTPPGARAESERRGQDRQVGADTGSRLDQDSVGVPGRAERGERGGPRVEAEQAGD